MSPLTEPHIPWDAFMDKYISHGVGEHDGQAYFVLTMKEYKVVKVYPKNKYCELELLQDIDIENEKHGLITHYYEKYCEDNITYSNN